MAKFFLQGSIFLFVLCTVGCTSAPADTTPAQGPQLTLAPQGAFAPHAIDGVLATVGDQPILLSNLQEAVLVTSQGHTQLLPSGKLVAGPAAGPSGAGSKLTPQNAQDLLNALISQKVLEIKAKDLGLTVSDGDLQNRIQEFLKKQNLTQQDLEAELARTGKTWSEYQDEFRGEVLKQLLIGRVISPTVTVTDDEVQSYYLQQTGHLKQIGAVELRSLMISTDGTTFEDAPLTDPRVADLEKKILAGEPFADLVRSYSMAANARENAGLLPPRPLQDLPQELQTRVADLTPGQVIGPFVIGRSVFFFEYLRSELVSGNDLEQNVDLWKNRLLNVKFNERLTEYLRVERNSVGVYVRPFQIS